MSALVATFVVPNSENERRIAACGDSQTENRKTADYADTRGWATYLVRIYPRVSASSAVLSS
jgi:hypothetical protein